MGLVAPVSSVWGTPSLNAKISDLADGAQGVRNLCRETLLGPSLIIRFMPDQRGREGPVGGQCMLGFLAWWFFSHPLRCFSVFRV